MYPIYCVVHVDPVLLLHKIYICSVQPIFYSTLLESLQFVLPQIKVALLFNVYFANFKMIRHLPSSPYILEVCEKYCTGEDLYVSFLSFAKLMSDKYFSGCICLSQVYRVK